MRELVLCAWAQLYTVECECHFYRFTEPWRNNSRRRKKSQEELIPDEIQMCEHYTNCFTYILRSLSLSFACSSNFICQIDGLGRSQNEQRSRDLMACNAVYMYLHCDCDCIETHERDVAGAHIFANFRSPLSRSAPYPVLASSIGARLRAISFRFQSN